MRIALYSHSFPPSIDGVCRRFSGYCKDLAAQGHELVVFGLEPELQIPLPEGAVKELIVLDAGYPQVYPDKKLAIPTVRSLFRITRALQRWRPDIVHITVDALASSFAAAGKLANVPVCGSIHTDCLKILDAVGAGALIKFATCATEVAVSKALSACATTSPSFQAKLKGLGASCDWVVPTAVPAIFKPDCAPASELEALRKELTFGHPEAFLVVFVGRLAPEKDLPALVEAVQRVPGAYLCICGDGPLRDELAALHGPDKRVHCRPGFKDHATIATYYACADVHASLSVFETLGNTVLEAHACGIPVCVPDAQGFCDTVLDGVDGLLVPEPTAAAVAAALARLAADPQWRRELGAKGRQKVLATRSDAAVARSLVAWYHRTLQAPPPVVRPRPRPLDGAMDGCRAPERFRRVKGKGESLVLLAGTAASCRVLKTLLVWLFACAIIILVQAYDDALILAKHFVNCKRTFILRLLDGKKQLVVTAQKLQTADCSGPKRSLKALKAVDCTGPKRALQVFRKGTELRAAPLRQRFRLKMHGA